LIKEAYQALCDTCKLTGDFAAALEYHEKYHAIESEILGEQAQKQLTNLNFMHNLEQKEKDLEIEQLRNVDLKRERDRSESLLLNILPAEVAEELKEKGSAGAKLFDNVTVLFTDFKSFTKVSERLTPQQLVDELHACFSAFDHIMAKYNIEKIKTVGDAYLAVAGLPLVNNNHAGDMVKAAIEIREFMINRKLETENRKHETFEIRIGIHSGSVVAGIVGIKKFAYDIWGDTVNTAARMEQNSEPGKINISQTTYELVKDKFNCEYRGEIEAKNKGLLRMYFVNK
jgi:class 3 adenylate cyclase